MTEVVKILQDEAHMDDLRHKITAGKELLYFELRNPLCFGVYPSRNRERLDPFSSI